MKSNTCLALFATLLALAIPRRVEAHGFVSDVQILGGTKFTGPKPGFTGANNSPIRAITDQSPVKDLQSNDMICGLGATPGTAVASAKPGDSLVYTWANTASDNGHWIHDTGPMLTYFAQVPSGQTADQFNGVGAKWFKTDQVGKKNNTWVQASLMTGSTFKTQIPETLADGDYLVRHEIIALHVAATKGGAEFYPSCFQLRIQNSNAGNATVTASQTVSFPGAYTATDPGILVDVFDQAPDGSEYQFPGGPIANVSAPGATGNPPNAIASLSASVSGTSTVIPATSTAATTTSAVSSVSAAAIVTSISAPVTSASATSSSAAAATPTSLQAMRLANGRTAQGLNLLFQSLTTSDTCEPSELGCVHGQFAVCTSNGTWSQQGACFLGTSCFAVPLTNTNGTQVGCFPEFVVQQAMIDSGAGSAIATGAASSAPLATASSTSSIATSIFLSTITPASTSTSGAVLSTSVVSSSSTTASASATPTTTPAASLGGGAPAIVVGVGSKPARRMLRWERRGFY